MIRYTFILFLLFTVGINSQKKTRLKVGDIAPTLSALKWVKGEPVKELAKGRIYIVEFGATWCKPCIAAMPHMTKLDRKYKKDLDVLSFFIMEGRQSNDDPKNPPYLKRVENLVKKYGDEISYHVAVDDFNRSMEIRWHRAAGFGGVPKSFIIDKDGYIAWMATSTNYDAIEKVVEYVNSPEYDLKRMIQLAEEAEKKTPKFDRNMPFLVNGNGGESDEYEYRSIFRKSIIDFDKRNLKYISSEGWFHDLPRTNKTKGLVQFVNQQLVDLYFAAYGDTLACSPRMRKPGDLENWWEDSNPYQKYSYGEYWHLPIMEVKDTSELGTTDWRKRLSVPTEMRYDYSVHVPEIKASARFIQKTMQQDLNKYFNYEVSLETRPMPYWKLTATNQAKKLLRTKTPGQKFRESFPENGSFIYKNAVIKDVIWSLGAQFGFLPYDYGRMPTEDQGPFIDETGLDIEIDYVVSKSHQQSFEGFKKYLESKGLLLTKSTKEMKVVVIRDPQS